ncbi:MAG: hypothetical protein ACLPVF_16345 [Acidimicrobiales bacterium]
MTTREEAVPRTAPDVVGEAGAAAPGSAPPARPPGWWLAGATTVVVIVGVIAVTLWQLHFTLLFTETTTTGGDTGSHIALPAFLQSLLSHGHIEGWDPGWYDGFALYTFYFALPDLFAAIGGWIIPYDIAFKLITVLGSVLLPVCAWACGRLFRLRPPIPTVMAAMTLPFLFDYTFTIYGGNLFSTLAGEYAYSFSLSLAILFLGLFARVVRGGTCRAWASVVLALCILSHIIPGMLALAGAFFLVVVELLPTRWGVQDDRLTLLAPAPPERAASRGVMVWRAASTVAIGLLLSGWWLVPFGLLQSYATSMGYANVTTYWATLLPEADLWVLALAVVGVVTAVILRNRFGLLMTALGTVSALGLVVDPQGKLYNVRLLPLWFICVYLMAGWVVGVGVTVLAGWWRRQRLDRWKADTAAAAMTGPPPSPSPRASHRRAPSWPWAPAAVGGSLLAFLGVLAIVTPPFFLPADDLPVTVGANEVSNWASYNYNGYQALPAYPEYRSLMDTMKKVGREHGCGRAMWEYNVDEGRFGTPEALMLLPYWTGGCIDSMEGLLFESSATTPYHFINQAELSAAPSDPDVTIDRYYGPLDVTLGVQHLQLLGVKYFMAETSQVESEADRDPDLKLVARTGPWPNGTLRTTWDIYQVEDAPLVQPLDDDPVVLKGIKSAPSSWLTPSMNWYLDPDRWKVELAESGPSSWPRQAIGAHPPAVAVHHTVVTHTHVTDSSVSFDVSRTGVPVLVKISYFPNWQATGADGPWRVTPNLMVVVPTSHHVTLTYGTTSIDRAGEAASFVGLVALVAVVAWPRIRARRRRPAATPPA